MATWLRWRLYSVTGLLLLLHLAEGAYQSQAMGFHEGARRTVRCDGGYIVGFDIYMGLAMGFVELTVNAVRIRCSSGKINLEYGGSTSDEHIFGNLETSTLKPQTVLCPASQGVAAVEWRRASSNDHDHTARIGGLRVHCSTEMNENPITVEVAPGVQKDYPAAVRCSDTSSPPKGQSVYATAVEVWYEQMFSGMHLLACEAAKS